MSILDIAASAALKQSRAYKNWFVSNPLVQKDINRMQAQERTFTTPQARKQYHEMCRKQLHDKFVPLYHKQHGN